MLRSLLLEVVMNRGVLDCIASLCSQLISNCSFFFFSPNIFPVGKKNSTNTISLNHWDTWQTTFQIKDNSGFWYGRAEFFSPGSIWQSGPDYI